MKIFAATLFVALATLACAIMELWAINQPGQSEWFDYLLFVLLTAASWKFGRYAWHLTESLFDLDQNESELA